MASFNKKYLQILKTARNLFWKHGFKRVSVEEVCQQAGVSKMTFYRFFANKIELAKAVFDKEANEGLDRFRQILAEPIEPAQKIKKIVLMKLEGTHEISREFLQDFYGNRELGLKEYIDQRTLEMWTAILNDFRSAQQKGWFRSDFKPEFLLYFSQRMGEMVADEQLLNLYHSPQELVAEISNFVSYGISPRPVPEQRSNAGNLNRNNKNPQ